MQQQAAFLVQVVIGRSRCREESHLFQSGNHIFHAVAFRGAQQGYKFFFTFL